MGYQLAIDFGTTNSVIARWDDGFARPEFVSVPGLSTPIQDGHKSLIPSLLYVTDGRTGQACLGQSVLDRELHLRRDNRLFRNFKRSMLARPLPEPRFIDGAPWNELDAGKRFLQGLLESMPFEAQEIEQLVVTVPVAAFEGYVAWLSEWVQDISAEAVRVTDESTAAALGYSVTEPGALVLVFDFGGGSLDLSLVQLPENQGKAGGLLSHLRGKSARQHTARVIAKAGLTLGGRDIDHWLLNDILRQIAKPPQSAEKDYAPLLSACEKAKVELSRGEDACLRIEVETQSYEIRLTRGELERMLEEQGFYRSVKRSVDRVMHIAQRQGIFKEDVQHVLLVGGTSLIPSVQDLLRDYFHSQAVQVDKPFTAVAEGALQLATGLGLDDYLAHSYGLRYLDPEAGAPRYDEIIAEGSRYPSHKPVEVILQAAHDQQEAVEFVIGEVDSEAVSMVEVKYEDGQAVFVAQAADAQQILPLNEPGACVVGLSPAGEPGIDRLRAGFRVDEGRRLRLSVFDLLSKKEILHEAVIASLEDGQGEQIETTQITGREPRLAVQRPGVQRLSLRSLGTLMNLLPPEAISLEAAREALHSKEFYVRFSAARLLSQRGDREARLIIQDVLNTGSVPQRASAAYHLDRFSWFVAEPLLRQALADPDLRVQECAVYALCHQAEANAYRLLVEFLEGADDNLRLAAAWGLSRNPDAGCIPVLEIVMKARDAEARLLALEVLGASQSPQALSSVRQALDDPDLDVKYAAVLSWMELEGEACLPELASLIESSPNPARLYLVRGLFHASNYLFIDLGKSQHAIPVIRALKACLFDELPDTRQMAAMPLAWTRHPEATAALIEGYLHEQDSEVKARLLFTAVQLMSPAGERLLQEALASSDPQLRGIAEHLQSSRPAS